MQSNSEINFPMNVSHYIQSSLHNATNCSKVIFYKRCCEPSGNQCEWVFRLETGVGNWVPNTIANSVAKSIQKFIHTKGEFATGFITLSRT